MPGEDYAPQAYFRGELERAQETTGNLQMELARSSSAERGYDSRAGCVADADEISKLRKELEDSKEELRKSQEEQLSGAEGATKREGAQGAIEEVRRCVSLTLGTLGRAPNAPLDWFCRVVLRRMLGRPATWLGGHV